MWNLFDVPSLLSKGAAYRLEDEYDAGFDWYRLPGATAPYRDGDYCLT